MGIHAAGTQHGLAYHTAPLEGKRAPVLIALMSRAPAAHVPFQPLQQLIWQIMGGLSYRELPPQSQQLVDQLIPEFRNRINEDFVEALRKTDKPDWLCKYVPGVCKASTEVDALVQRYEQTRQTLLRNANNFEALSRQMVNVVPGMADNPGPSSWSRVSPRVYVRLADGNFYGQMDHLQIRVLPSNARSASALPGPANVPAVSYSPTATDAVSDPGSDLADVPLQAMIAYPNAANMQGLGWTPEGGGVAQLVVTALKVDSPLDSVTIWLPAPTSSGPFPSHTLFSPSCIAVTFTNQDQGQLDAVAGVTFFLKLTVLNQSQYDLATPTIQLVQTNPPKDALGQQPRWMAVPMNAPAEIPAGRPTTLSWQVTATWYTFSQPDALVQFLRQLAADQASHAVDLLNNLKVIASGPAGVISGALGVAPDLINLLQTRFTIAVNYQLVLNDAGSSVAQLNVPVIAPPQEIGAFSVYAPWKLYNLGLTDVLNIVFPGLGDVSAGGFAYVVCHDLGQNSNGCVIASAPVDDSWYDSVFSQGNIVSQSVGTQSWTSPGAPLNCQSIIIPGSTAVRTSTASGDSAGRPSRSSTRRAGGAASRNSLPSVSGASPSQGPAGAVVTIRGTGFNSVTAVTFGNTPATYTRISQTTIKATVPDLSWADNQIKALGAGSQVGVTVTVKTQAGSANSLFNYTGPR